MNLGEYIAWGFIVILNLCNLFLVLLPGMAARQTEREAALERGVSDTKE